MKLKINEIKSNPNNPRIIKDDKFKKLVQSIKDFPEMLDAREIVVNKDYIILGGNMRFKAAKEAGLKELPVKIVDWPEDKQREFIIKDNVSGGEWDWDLLANEWDSELLNDWGLDVPDDWGGETEIEEDEAPGVDESEPPVSKLGEVYQLGRHRVFCGDSTVKENVEKLMNGEKADMVFTDPPFPNNSEIMHEMIKNIDSAFNNSRIFCDGLMIWFWDNLEFPPFLEQVTSKHIWHKTNGWQAGHFETMYCYHNDSKRHEQKVYSINNVGGENNREEQGNHPTPKPISLVFNIVNDLSKNSKLILDLFLGSGTTMVAAHQLNRKCYGMELDPKYVDVIRKRYHKFVTGSEEGWIDGTPAI